MFDIENIAKKIESIGGQTFLVGGALRDELLGRKIEDKDYCVTGITSKQFQELFPEAFVRGKAFEVFDLYGNEFAMARKEVKSGVGHKSFEIETSANITIEEDLARRDVTINAIAKNVLTGEIIDPYNGAEDIKNKIIRATTNKFAEDPLRVYRVARFAAVLEFEIEENTIKLMNSLKSELGSLSAERVFSELKKALSAKKPSIFFEVLKRADVLDCHFIEIYNLIGALQPEKYHPEGDAYNHTMMVLDKASKMSENEEIRFAALVHDLGKGATPKEEYPHHYGHEERGVELVSKLANRIKAPTSWLKSGKTACKEHMRGGLFNQMKPAKKVDFIERVSKSMLGLHGLQIIVNSDKLSTSNIDKENINFEEIGNECLNKITGEMVSKKYGIKPGIELGKKLREERIAYLCNSNVK